MEAEDVLCVPCRAEIRRVSGVLCSLCGRMMPHIEGPDPVCSSCLEHKVAFDCARAAFIYDGVVARLIRRAKSDRISLAARAIAGITPRPPGPLILAEIDVVTSVPMTPKRLRTRMVNSGHVIAARLAGEWGVPYDPSLLIRAVDGPPQRLLPASRRWANVAGAFRADDDKVRNKAVLLIDDMITTGATAHSCAGALKRAGAAWVGAYAVARTSDRA